MAALEMDTVEFIKRPPVCMQDTDSCIQINIQHCAVPESLQAACFLNSFTELKYCRSLSSLKSSNKSLNQKKKRNFLPRSNKKSNHVRISISIRNEHLFFPFQERFFFLSAGSENGRSQN